MYCYAYKDNFFDVEDIRQNSYENIICLIITFILIYGDETT
ncbi:hypothetical protein M116_2376 [Bacteroides fragilis str. 3719 A10]|nr:hypothetical protein M116_2376 [Bacteroides fragilis str. 3719 A10]